MRVDDADSAAGSDTVQQGLGMEQEVTRPDAPTAKQSLDGVRQQLEHVLAEQGQPQGQVREMSWGAAECSLLGSIVSAVVGISPDPRRRRSRSARAAQRR